MIINNITELAAYLGAYEATSEAIARRLFKDTQCGIACQVDDSGITVSGYAEGSNADCPEHRLSFPFSEDLINAAIRVADEEGCEAWHEANDK